MMRKSLFLTVVSILAYILLTVNVAATEAATTPFSYEAHWKVVEDYIKAEKPESALNEVKVIMKQAETEKKTQQWIKAKMSEVDIQQYNNPENRSELLMNFEKLTNQVTNKVDQAFIQSMTAELYLSYYTNHRNSIQQRREIVAFTPKWFEEWDQPHFLSKIISLLSTSMQQATVLQKTPIDQYKILLTSGNTQELEPTVFDYLVRRNLEMLEKLHQTVNVKKSVDFSHLLALPVKSFVTYIQDTNAVSAVDLAILKNCQQWLSFRLNSTNPEAYIRAESFRIQLFNELIQTNENNYFGRSNQTLTSNDENYLKALRAVTSRYQTNENSLYVLEKEARFYAEHTRPADSVARYYKRKAYDLCEGGINRFPLSKYLGLLKNLQLELTKRELNIEYNDVAKRNDSLEVTVNSTNIEQLELCVYRVNATAIEYVSETQNQPSKNTLYPNRTLVKKQQVPLNFNANFNQTTTSIRVPSGDYGIYEFTLCPLGDQEEAIKGSFVVSNLTYIFPNNDPTRLYVMNRYTGKPIPQVTIHAFSNKRVENKYQVEPLNVDATSDASGLLQFSVNPIENNREGILLFEQGADQYYTSKNNFRKFELYQQASSSMKISLFTDRAIYRPGQTVHFKGIAYEAHLKRRQVTADQSVRLTLCDANNKEITAIDVVTNEFGSFSGTFILPDKGLSGAFRLRVNYLAQAVIWVEEYKRPTFEVVLERPKNDVRFGEPVQVSGLVSAFAGYRVTDAQVTYQVIQSPHYRWLASNQSAQVVASGTCMTSGDGRFTVTFTPQKNGDSKEDSYYTYQVKAVVTDQKGETQEGEKNLAVGDKTVFIETNLTTGVKLDKDKPIAFSVNVVTLNEEKVTTEVVYSLYKTKPSDTYVDAKRSYTSEMAAFKLPASAVKILSGSFLTQNDSLKLDLMKQESGAYILHLSTKDNQGKLVQTYREVVLYSNQDMSPPVKSYSWLLTPTTVCAVGEKAVIRFGTTVNDASVLYQLMQGSEMLESKWITFSNEMRTFEIPFLSNYGAGVTAQFLLIRDEQFFSQSVPITLKVEERKLNPKLTVFRNKLLPGENAEWVLSIPEASKNKLTAEVMIDMYDASLDALRSHRFVFNPTYQNNAPSSPSWRASIISKINNQSFNIHPFPIANQIFSRFNWIQKEFNEKAIFTVVGRQSYSETGFSINEPISTLKNVSSNNPTIAPLKIRTNFNETAFFYPQLRTDNQGNVAFSFTVPESLTRWNVKMLAHTQDLYSGYAETQVVTQKDFMVQLNLPRFVRKSDKLLLKASVVNLTNQTQNAEVKLELINPETNQTIALRDNQRKKVTVAANTTQTVEWKLTEFSPYELVVCKVVASSGSFSDGEQHYLPVLTNQVLITESVPMTVRVNQTRTFTLENLTKSSRKVDSKSLTVEFSPNPVWYAVQALPTLSVAENDNAFDYFTAYYVNTLAAHIANTSPEITAVLEQWKQAGGSRDALLSNLEKNKELKNMLLEETPWVMAAENETEQKKQIALLFDLNTQKQQNSLYWDKLLKLQQPSGGFSWYEGMSESRYVTQFIALNYGRVLALLKEKNLNTDPSSVALPEVVKRSTGIESTVEKSIRSAIAYLDNEISLDYELLKQRNSNYQSTMNIGNMQWFYLHLRSEYPEIPIPLFATEAVNFYTKQAFEHWQQATLYGKAATALIAARSGNKTLAADILTSLKENAAKSDDMGMYWPKNTAGFSWNERPVMVQTAILEAFAELNNNTTDLDELKIWLLRQKQTQRWDSPLSTVDAVFALMLKGSDWLSTGNEVELKLGNETLRPETKEAGTGYFKQSFTGDNITPKMGTATVKLKGNSGFGWGALYWQYDQKQDQVQQSGNALKVSKKLFVEVQSTTGKVITPIEQVTLKKGDRVITQLVVSVDRDLEFVALKDLRAACFEPVNQRSGYEWKQGVGYYQTTKDASTQFFFSSLPKGHYVFEYEVFANNAGEYTSGVTTLQCQYAPEFVAHSAGEWIGVK